MNRLAMLSMILGVGAALTGYFGMNFGRTFGTTFFAPSGGTDVAHLVAIAFVSIFSLFAVLLGSYVIVANWSDYRDIFRLRRKS